ncbi:RHS repeat-associated core domain-containing protein, partial [Halomonas sp. SIMBA_159]
MYRDQLGSIRKILNGNSEEIKNATYAPFGTIDERVSSAGLATAEETKGFIGERFDAGAGLQYLNARYYDPELASFIP